MGEGEHGGETGFVGECDDLLEKSDPARFEGRHRIEDNRQPRVRSTQNGNNLALRVISKDEENSRSQISKQVFLTSSVMPCFFNTSIRI